MKNQIFIFLFTIIASYSVFSQHQITGQIRPLGKEKIIIMYKTEGAFQYYKASASVDEKGLFGFALPENFEVGNYKLVYDAQKDLAVNIIYNNKDIAFVFAPLDVINTIFFYDSKNNSLFYDYVQSISKKYDDLSVIQKELYKKKSDDLLQKYDYKIGEIKAFQDHFEKESTGIIANSFIKSFKKPLSETPFNTKEEKYAFLKENYLQNINFQDSLLRNSSFLIDRINEYVFDLNEAIASLKNEHLDTSMIVDALALIEKSTFKNEIIYSLTSSSFDPYSAKYDLLLDFLYLNYYKQLPEEAKNKNFTDMVVAKLNAIVGKKAPNINLGENYLYNIQSDSTLVIFWSSTCSHCLKEIPEIYKLLENDKHTKVILIGLEEDYSDWENVSKPFSKWINIKAKGKWKNENAINYNIKGTPSYFLLDSNKMIVAKPGKLKDLKEVFGMK